MKLLKLSTAAIFALLMFAMVPASANAGPWCGNRYARHEYFEDHPYQARYYYNHPYARPWRGHRWCRYGDHDADDCAPYAQHGLYRPFAQGNGGWLWR